MKKIIVFIFLISFFGCKEDKKNDNTEEKSVIEEVTKKISNVDYIKITLNAIVPNDDTFVIQYSEEQGFNYNAKDKIFVSLQGSEIPQNIVFEFPEKIIPANFKLQIGTNNKKGIIINNLRCENQTGGVFEIQQNMFSRFFGYNKYINYNTKESTFTLREVDKKFNPTFISKKVLIEKLEESM